MSPAVTLVPRQQVDLHLETYGACRCTKAVFLSGCWSNKIPPKAWASKNIIKWILEIMFNNHSYNVLLCSYDCVMSSVNTMYVAGVDADTHKNLWNPCSPQLLQLFSGSSPNFVAKVCSSQTFQPSFCCRGGLNFRFFPSFGGIILLSFCCRLLVCRLLPAFVAFHRLLPAFVVDSSFIGSSQLLLDVT